jgi:hypothetical protein
MSAALRWIVFAAGFLLTGYALHVLILALNTRPIPFGTALMAAVWLFLGLTTVVRNEPPIVDRAFRWLWRQDP